MILDMIALLIPQPSVTIDGVEYTENVNVIKLTGEHEVIGNFGFIQMTPQDYEWVNNEAANAAVLHEMAAIDAYTEELIDGGLL